MEKEAIRSIVVWLEIMEGTHEITAELRLLIGRPIIGSIAICICTATSA